MEKQTYCTMFGLQQSEMAALLGISRSHYAMFESGKRPLPLAARQILNELLAHHQSTQPKTKAKQPHKAAIASLQKHLKNLLQENEYQSQKLEREIAAVERKHAKATGVLHLQNFAAARGNASAATAALSRVPLASKLATAENNDFDMVLMKLRVRQELLEVEKKYLTEKLKSV